MIYDRHHTDIQCDDAFTFRGLTGQGVGEDIVITIMDVHPMGMIRFHVIDPSDKYGPSPREIPYERAVVLVDQGIWKERR